MRLMHAMFLRLSASYSKPNDSRAEEGYLRLDRVPSYREIPLAHARSPAAQYIRVDSFSSDSVHRLGIWGNSQHKQGHTPDLVLIRCSSEILRTTLECVLLVISSS